MPTKQTHPFKGGRKTSGITSKHRKLIWENMLGTVMACNPVTGEEKYFDYNWDQARSFALVDQCEDLRICALAFGPTYMTPGGRAFRNRHNSALYGIPIQPIAHPR